MHQRPTEQMQFEIGNLGPIVEGRLELGGLTIICGGNNTGKTYLAYSLYGFFRHCQRYRSNTKPGDEGTLWNTPGFLEGLFSTGKASLGTSPEAIFHASLDYTKQMLEDYRGKLHTIFAGESSRFDDAVFEYLFEEVTHKRIIERRLRRAERFRLLYELDLAYVDDQLNFSFKTERGLNHHAKNTASAIKYLSGFLDNYFLRPPIRRPFILTSERLGISLFYKDLDSSRNVFVEGLQKLPDAERRQEYLNFELERMSRYARPISDEINFARGLDKTSKKKDTDRTGTPFKLHEMIEQMMGAGYQADKNSIRLVSNAADGESFNILLHLASASSRELAHFYFYLKNHARPFDFLIFDEPESHLSSRNLVLLARLLCAFANKGVKVLITTHSETLLKEINNLIMLGGLPHDKATLDAQREEYKELEGLDKEKVKAYCCADGKINEVEVTKFGVDLDKVDGEPRVISENARFFRQLVADTE